MACVERSAVVVANASMISGVMNCAVDDACWVWVRWESWVAGGANACAGVSRARAARAADL